MREAVICEPVRTPVGRYGGALRDVPAHELAATALRGLIERTGLTSADIDDVLLGQCYPNPDAPAIGRVAALDAGAAPVPPVCWPAPWLPHGCGSLRKRKRRTTYSCRYISSAARWVRPGWRQSHSACKWVWRCRSCC